jgi:hypothetical protein
MSAMDDVFGELPGRPDHPDYWRISEIVLRHDGAVEEAPIEERNAAWMRLIGELVDDLEGLTDVAMKRTMFALGAQADYETAAKATASFIDGFATGAEYAGGKSTPGRRINAAVQRLDAAVRKAEDEDAKEATFTVWASAYADYYSIVYAGVQRARRLLGIRTVADHQRQMATLEGRRVASKMGTLWVEGFVSGAAFAA